MRRPAAYARSCRAPLGVTMPPSRTPGQQRSHARKIACAPPGRSSERCAEAELQGARSLGAPAAGTPSQHVPVAARAEFAEDTSALFGARLALGAIAVLGRGDRPRRASPCPAYATTSQDYRDPRKCPIPPELPGDRELLASPTRCGKLGS